MASIGYTETDPTDWIGINKGVRVAQRSGPHCVNEQDKKWETTFSVSPDLIYAPRDPETQDDSKYKCMNFTISQKPFITTPEEDTDYGKIYTVVVKATVKVGGSSSNRTWIINLPTGRTTYSDNLGVTNGPVVYRIEWKNSYTVEIKQATNFQEEREWEITSIKMCSQFSTDHTKRFECRAGLTSSEAVNRSTTPSSPIKRVDLTNENQKVEKNIWGGLSLTNENRLYVSRGYRTAADSGMHIISENSFVYVEPDSRMPKLRAFILPSPEGNVQWKVRIDYERYYANNKKYKKYSHDETYPNPSDTTSWTTQNGKEKWPISEITNSVLGSHVRGGTATVTLRQPGKLDREFPFHIRGVNPSDAVAKAYIQGRPNAPWYAYAIAKHESKSRVKNETYYNQFNPGSNPSFPENQSGGEILCPNQSFDGGAGIMQLTNPKATTQQLWSWKANCEGGVTLLQQKRAHESDTLTTQRALSGNTPIPTQTIGGITFGDATNANYSILDAATIKAYNGNGWPGGHKHFAEWNATDKKWDIYKLNFYGSYNAYIKKVVEERD